MKAFIKIVAFAVFFGLFLLLRFPYDSLVERAVRQAETATGATILYSPGSAGPFGVRVKNLSVRMASGAHLQFDSAKIYPSRNGLKATAFQGENEMRVNFNGSLLEVELDDITVKTGNAFIGTTRGTGSMTYGVHTRDGKGELRLVVPQLGLPIFGDSVDIGSTFVIKNTGTEQQPLTGVSAELKLLSGDGSSSANGTISLQGQPPPSSPLLNGTLRYEKPSGRGTVRLSGTWDNPVKKIIPN